MTDAPTRPFIAQDVLAARYAINDVYENVSLLTRLWPDIPVSPELRAIVGVYEERREAARAELKSNPQAAVGRPAPKDRVPDPSGRFDWTDAATGRLSWNDGDPAKSAIPPVVAPPSDAETAALKATLELAVREWRQLQKTVAVDRAALEEEFNAHYQAGDMPAAHQAWWAWVQGVGDENAREVRRDELRDLLCIRVRREGASRPHNPPMTPNTPYAALGAAGADGMPRWADACRNAMERMPPEAPAKRAAKGSAG